MIIVNVNDKCYCRIKLSYTINRPEKISVYFIAIILFHMKASSILQHSFKVINPVKLCCKYFVSAE